MVVKPVNNEKFKPRITAKKSSQDIEDMQTNELVGIVHSVTFQNEGNGWTVCEIEVNGKKETITAVGVMPNISIGESFTATGNWTSHKLYGEQFSVATYESTLPNEKNAIYKYLSSGAVRGIGPAMADKIVEKFGDKTFDILENSPQLLSEIKGITLKKAQEISQSFGSQNGLREVMVFLQRFDFTPSTSVRIYKAMGNNAIQTINENPYALCERVIGINFEKADNIAMGLNFENTDARRLTAGVLYALKHIHQYQEDMNDFDVPLLAREHFYSI